MNTASFDYAVLNDSVASELESLRAEKQQLSENIREKQIRLAEISLREEKLARFSESLDDLLTFYQSGDNAGIAAKLSEIEKAAEAENSPTRQAPEKPIAASPEKTNQKFSKAEFLKSYPYLKDAQKPIHILAEKLLEYIGRPTKLRDLTDYIVELGYRHNSQNFTNTVHTVLKLKGARNGHFYFDPKERKWELGFWRSGDSQADDAVLDIAPESNSASLESPVNQLSSQKVNKTADDANKSIAKMASPRKIKVIKAASRNF